MFAKLVCLLLLGVSLSAAIMPPTIKANQKLLEIMSAQYNEKAVRRSMDSYNCFNHYIPILNQITDKLENDYYNCENDATKARKKIDQETSWKRQELEKTSDKAYSNFNDCQWLESAEPCFECYQNTAATNSRIMYNISISAGDALLEVREGVRLIVITEDGCKSTADRTYVEDTTKTYDSLNNCLSGGDQIKQ